MYIDAYWAADVVFCVDKSSHMLLSQVGTFVEEFCERVLESMEFVDKQIQDFRIKIIAYGDLSTSTFDISPFFNYYDDNEKMSMFEFLDSIEMDLLDGNRTVDALEALASAIDSEWTNKGSRRRHIIVMLNQHTCSVLGAHRTSMYYPDNMPIDLRQLTDWWEGTDATLRSTYQPKYGRMVALAPNTEPWTDLQCWNRYWPEFWESKTPIDFESIMMLLSGGFG